MSSVPTLNRKNPKWTLALNRPCSDDNRGSTVPSKLPEILPKQEDTIAYKTSERIRKGSARDRENNESSRRGFPELTSRRRRKGDRNSSLWARDGLQMGTLEPSSSGEQNSQPPSGRPRQETEGKRRKEEDRKRKGEGRARPSLIGKGSNGGRERERGGP